MAIYSVVKPMGQRFLKPFVAMFSTCDPDKLTWNGLFCSLIAGACLVLSEYKPMLFAAVIFILLRMAFNVLDGMVARETGRTTAHGEALAEFTDRLSDVAIFSGAAFSIYCTVTIGLLGVIIILLVSYLGILGKAVGADRQFGGIMGKVDRLILLMVFAAGQFFFPQQWIGVPQGWRNFDILMIIIVAGGMITIVQRWLVILKQLAGRQEKRV